MDTDDQTITSALELLDETITQTNEKLRAHGEKVDDTNVWSTVASLSTFRPTNVDDKLPLPFGVLPPINPPGLSRSVDESLISKMQVAMNQFRPYHYVSERAVIAMSHEQYETGKTKTHVGNPQSRFVQTPERLDLVQPRQQGDEYPNDLPPLLPRRSHFEVLLEAPLDADLFVLRMPQTAAVDVDVVITPLNFDFEVETDTGFYDVQIINRSGSQVRDVNIPASFASSITNDKMYVWVYVNVNPHEDTLWELAVTPATIAGLQRVDGVDLDGNKLYSDPVVLRVNIPNMYRYYQLFTSTLRYIDLESSYVHLTHEQVGIIQMPQSLEVLKVRGQIMWTTNVDFFYCPNLRYLENISLESDFGENVRFTNTVSLTKENFVNIRLSDAVLTNALLLENSGLDGEFESDIPFVCNLNNSRIEKLTLNANLAVERTSNIYQSLRINMPRLKQIETNEPLDFALNRDGSLFSGCHELKELPPILSGDLRLSRFVYNCYSLERINFENISTMQAATDIFHNNFSLKEILNFPVNLLQYVNLETLISLQKFTLKETITGTIPRFLLNFKYTKMDVDGLLEFVQHLPQNSGGVITIGKWQRDLFDDNQFEELTYKVHVNIDVIID